MTLPDRVVPETGPPPEDGESHEPLPQQERHFRAPARFGHAPTAITPLGWDPRNPHFRNHYPWSACPRRLSNGWPWAIPKPTNPTA